MGDGRHRQDETPGIERHRVSPGTVAAVGAIPSKWAASPFLRRTIGMRVSLGVLVVYCIFFWSLNRDGRAHVHVWSALTRSSS